MDLVGCLLILGICFSGGEPQDMNNQQKSGNMTSGLDETFQCDNKEPCPPDSQCHHVGKRYYCSCSPGFNTFSGNVNFTDIREVCEDINECLVPHQVDCGPYAECKNTDGSYHCICLQGYQTKSRVEQFKNKNETSCEDVDECKEHDAAVCDLNASCLNTPGSFACLCDEGFQLRSRTGNLQIAGEVHCEDIDECDQPDPPACGSNATCSNTPGGFDCRCRDGFQTISGGRTFQGPKTNESRCQDVDECKRSPTTCQPFGTCVNTPGDYICKCLPGFVKSNQDPRRLCRDINECTSGPVSGLVCGPHGSCENTPGAYTCACHPGYLSSENLVNWDSQRPVCLKVQCRTGNPSQPEPTNNKDDNFLHSLKTFIKSTEPLCSSLKSQPDLGETQLKAILNEVDKQSPEARWKTLQPQERHQLASELMQLMEEVARGFMWLLPNGTTDIGTLSKITIWKGNRRKCAVKVSQERARMTLDWNTGTGANSSGPDVMGFLTLKDMEAVLSDASLKGWNKTAGSGGKHQLKVISQVVTAFISSENTANLSSPVNFTFSHQNVKNETICVYWSYGEHQWSREGCHKLGGTANETVCACSHLSSFAVLMAHYEIESWQLNVVTIVGLVISLLCLLVSILTFMFCRVLQGTRNTIHLHLCVSLFLAYTVFLVGISATANKTGCSVVAGPPALLLPGLLLLDVPGGGGAVPDGGPGLQDAHPEEALHVLVGYGVPTLVVAVSAASNSRGYGTRKHCWLSMEGGFLWSFLAPVCLIVLVNAVIFVITVLKLAKKFSTINPDISKLKKIRTFTITAIAQLCILGLTWIFGLFQFSNDTLAISYIFTILNSFQGLFIFLLHCLLKKQVREEYLRWLRAAIRLKKPDKYSTFTSSATPSSSASVSRGLQTSKESGM
ncbi:LOW QUALITY PROTEIN: CD97 antigen-like [Rhinatrema bivittatum]|uniref:LOW QUALITY PROTEIN: CD97 antigen-like n=1 Tax=Rhinatrema bivittatum TaxID=194408 RepID=UPI0011261F66|nr:LOW QUALITY PROTEIN: CD97 antigen-like [Rhinatrema bivittatum]